MAYRRNDFRTRSGSPCPADAEQLIRRLPKTAWSPAYDADGETRTGAFVAELTGLLDLSGWPPGMRVIIRSERPHPGAQLRITDIDGNRITAFATNSRRGQLADLEIRHRRRARCEDRIRLAKDTGLTNLPLHDFDQNRIWCAIVMLACDLIAWMQMLAYPASDARRWEPKRLRLRLFSAAGRIARHGRQHRHPPRPPRPLEPSCCTTASQPAAASRTRITAGPDRLPTNSHPGSGTGAHRHDTSGELSHPHPQIDRATVTKTPDHDQPAARETSGLAASRQSRQRNLRQARPIPNYS